MILSLSLGNHSTGAPGFDMCATNWGHACSVPQPCSTLCDPMDCRPSGCSVQGILQARTLEWVVIFLLQGLFLTQGPNPHLLRLLHQQADSWPLSQLGSPMWTMTRPGMRQRSWQLLQCWTQKHWQPYSFQYNLCTYCDPPQSTSVLMRSTWNNEIVSL